MAGVNNKVYVEEGIPFRNVNEKLYSSSTSNYEDDDHHHLHQAEHGGGSVKKWNKENKGGVRRTVYNLCMHLCICARLLSTSRHYIWKEISEGG